MRARPRDRTIFFSRPRSHAPVLCVSVCSGETSADSPPAPGTPPPLARAFHYGAWALLGLVFAAAAFQGADFASHKFSASLWGGIIGLAAFLAFLAVDEEEAGEDVDDDEDGEDDVSLQKKQS